MTCDSLLKTGLLQVVSTETCCKLMLQAYKLEQACYKLFQQIVHKKFANMFCPYFYYFELLIFNEE